MAYVATRGGERAIEQAERLYRAALGPITPERVAGIRDGMPLLIDRVMGEASLYAPDLAALALAQTGGDLYEAVMLLRAWRTTQPRLAIAQPIQTGEGLTHRRVSAAFKDIPGGQILGPTLDYSHRMLATAVLSGATVTPRPVEPAARPAPASPPPLADWQRAQGLLAPLNAPEIAPDAIPDVTREPLLFPASRAHTLQSLARADTGGMLALGYSAMRGYGQAHPTVNELRLTEAPLRVTHPCGTIFSAGRIRVGQAEVVNAKGAQLKLGFCASFGWNEVKTIAGATLDLNSPNAAPKSPTNPEFFLYHTEPVEASGFCIHFKLPHYVTFQSALDNLRGAARQKAEPGVAPELEPAE
ncbi:phosphonate metabolism protein PhnI [Paracoccus suum]|uniref:Phosphonate metabolism protein PhnI n=1 Tax=Paracoccus suum TaxID=2259340 RepID=A0A344PJA9_9RHOB|nr:carbon-phosphorus lyase complex subunit PhnI [Paracoccus suum]AXC49464.1 phosphonate metabolism protein PhnI [Paracoccus suum]